MNRPIITIGKISRSPWITLVILSCFGLISTFADTMILPAIPDIIKDFKISYNTSSSIRLDFKSDAGRLTEEMEEKATSIRRF